MRQMNLLIQVGDAVIVHPSSRNGQLVVLLVKTTEIGRSVCMHVPPDGWGKDDLRLGSTSCCFGY